MMDDTSMLGIAHRCTHRDTPERLEAYKRIIETSRTDGRDLIVRREIRRRVLQCSAEGGTLIFGWEYAAVSGRSP